MGEVGNNVYYAVDDKGPPAAPRNDPCDPCSSFHLGLPGFSTPRKVLATSGYTYDDQFEV